jgi:aryl-alcohol dehydrogenase-like predicted oxidoreductase
MEKRPMGKQGIIASQLGLGCMGMSEFYGVANDEHSLLLLAEALELGVNFWDTADMYGPFKNELLISKALKGKRDKITLATKFGIVRSVENPSIRGLNGTPAYVQSACEASLKRLETDYIDLYYLHRKDPATPIEETVGAMSKLVEQGKVRAIGLSEVSASTLRKAHAVFPITALQTEYSLWSREPEDEILATCKELGIAFVPYSPLGRGFLTGQIKHFDDFAPDDYRRFSPRFQGENFNKNLELVKHLEKLAAEKNCTASQLALAWVVAQGDFIFPIPGTKKSKYLKENIASIELVFSSKELAIINELFSKDAVSGTRYPESMMGSLNA